VGSGQIYQGSLEYQTINTSATTRVNYTVTQSFISSSWSGLLYLVAGAGSFVNEPSYQLPSTGFAVFEQSSSAYHMLTGSGINDDCFYLRGGIMASSASSSPTGYQICFGGGLALTHNYNQYLDRGIIATGSYLGGPVAGKMTPGIPANTKINPSNEDSWIYLDYSGSMNNAGQDLLGYEDFSQPFLIKVGDEIRVTYSSTLIAKDSVTVDFTVVDMSGNTDYENDIYIDNLSGSMVAIDTFLTPYYVTGSLYNYDKIRVVPSPADLEVPIPQGKIYNFTIRRRINADDRVIIYQSAPSGSEGVKTISGEGFLIPDDLNPTQKRNVLTLINQLSAKNAFRASEDPPSLKE